MRKICMKRLWKDILCYVYNLHFNMYAPFKYDCGSNIAECFKLGCYKTVSSQVTWYAPDKHMVQ